MRKIIFVAIVALLLNLSLVNAITQQEISEAKSLIDSKADCKSLSNSQLEIIGEYYMEQMHPGEAHELMHKMMGLEEGSEAEEQFHINMAKTMYCNENTMMGGAGSGMMGMMSMMIGGNMMGEGMMSNNMMGEQTLQTSMMRGIMGNSIYGFAWNIGNFVSVLYLILLIGLIILVYLWIIKLWKNLTQKRR